MAKFRSGVELHPDGCRLVEVELATSSRRTMGRARSAASRPADVRVRAFAPAVPGGSDPAALAESLGRLRHAQKLSKDVWVTVWGLRAVHQILRLPPARIETLEPIARREARRDLAPLEAQGGSACVSIVAGPEVQVGTTRKREVSLVAVSASDLSARIQPLIDAGFVVRGVVTPALALAAVARRDANSRGTAAYVAMTGRATCIAIIRDGLLLFAREMPWGHEEKSEVRSQKSEVGSQKSEVGSEKVDVRLASELKRSILFFKQTFRAPVEAVVLCGDMPALRSLTAPLGEALDLPVETLDSLVGIDAAAVPQPADLFRSSVASLRLAMATAADAAPPANLLPKTILETRAAREQIARLIVSAAAGLVLVAGWYTVSRSTLGSLRAERDAIQQQLQILEPDAVRIANLQQAYTLAVSRQAALSAFDSQGPRLARFLETVAEATPDEIALNLVDLQPEGAYWRVVVRGLATSTDAAVAQAAVNTMVEALSASPFAGPPTQPPSRRVITSRGSGVSRAAFGGAAASGDEAVQIPAGMTGVEFSMLLRVAK